VCVTRVYTGVIHNAGESSRCRCAILVTIKHDEMSVTRTPANLHHDYLGVLSGLKMKSTSSIKMHILRLSGVYLRNLIFRCPSSTDFTQRDSSCANATCLHQQVKDLGFANVRTIVKDFPGYLKIKNKYRFIKFF